MQWATADTILLRVDKEKLHGDIDRIAGKEFLENIRKRHTSYGSMVQRLLARDSSATVNLSDEVRLLGRAIVAYATQVCAFATEHDDDEAALIAAETALRPLDVFRELSAERSGAAQESANPAAEPAAEAPEEK